MINLKQRIAGSAKVSEATERVDFMLFVLLLNQKPFLIFF